MKNNKYIWIASIVSIMTFSSCTNELDQSPIDPDSFTEKNVFSNVENVKSALAKVYASLVLTGQSGPAGDADIQGIDEGTSQFSRMLFYMNELTTDHAVVGWGDPGLPDLHEMSWSSSNTLTEAMYYRLAQVVSFSNSFIVNATPLNDDVEVQYYIAEARFLRAYAYYNLLDLYGAVPITTTISTELPLQMTRKQVFEFVEGELLDVQNLLKDSGANEYGRVDKVAAWALLSRLYLNAEVYINENKYNECVTFSEKVINSSYIINTIDANSNGTAYDELFLADNDSNGAQNEFIFALNFDGLNSQTYAGTTFLIHASIGGTMDPADFGVNGGWFGLRTTKTLVQKFSSSVTGSDSGGDPIAWSDTRAMFYTDGQNLEITTIANEFTDGYAVTKFKNVDSNGAPGSDATGNFTDTDLPMIRLAEIYLNYAEATVRGGAGSIGTAVDLMNELRERAYGNQSGNIVSGDLDISFIMNERSRELYWEGFRRTDLIRNNQFTESSYLWPFKGGVAQGIGVGKFRDNFPFPTNIILTNPNIEQNNKY
ncbi:RagB/SusD family nutrient uptake outer membrane protein [Wenyingzhuangia marina]|uniref:Starch-binding associating with outer membrane n=1 Tax=Wenyingzhuangia marina TaxID=1195760 RepID=A0A1M5T987_9FLAO|nr:RagB/SusD family nutrient uptake outer membrane protein [Wenyingzhuangia marina]GGF65888.1 outer membrane protein [Wenyingzhuangia marina]SHH47274.1 Starch-binding associating with outer membrane [Wenyingzhuangia marina]